MTISQKTAPAAEPISLTEAKINLRLSADAADAVANGSHYDPILSRLIAAARVEAEVFQWRSLVLQVFDLFLDGWPDGDAVEEIPSPPLRAVEFVQYTDSTGIVATFPAGSYSVDVSGTPGRVVLADGASWPSVSLAANNPIHIRFKAGYAVPFTAAESTDTLTALNHPFIDGEQVRLSVSGGVLPTGLVEKKDYFVRDVSGNTLKLAETAGGAAINFTSAGSGSMFIGEIPQSTIIAMLLSIADRFEGRNDSERAIQHWLSMDAARGF